MVLLLKYLGWSWQDYLAAPPWVIETAIIQMKEEAHAKHHGN